MSLRPKRKSRSGTKTSKRPTKSASSRKLLAWTKRWCDDPEIRTETRGNQLRHYVIFYHGTRLLFADDIKRMGLKGGYNLVGGTHGTFDQPLLYLAQTKTVARKYGTVFEVRIPLSKIKKFMQKTTVSVDGLGDRVYIVRASQRNEVLIPPAYLEHIDYVPRRRGFFGDEYW